MHVYVLREMQKWCKSYSHMTDFNSDNNDKKPTLISSSIFNIYNYTDVKRQRNYFNI